MQTLDLGYSVLGCCFGIYGPNTTGIITLLENWFVNIIVTFELYFLVNFMAVFRILVTIFGLFDTKFKH